MSRELNEKPDYSVDNFCRKCKKTYPKTEKRCFICNNLLRTVPVTAKNKTKYKDIPRI